MNLEPLFKYWQKLPCSVQLRCLNNLDIKTRKSLRMCSWDEKHLVEFFVEWSKFKWRDLPLSVQMKCVEFMDRDTRTSLKLCCSDEKHLVEYVPSRKLEYCDITIKQSKDSQYLLKYREGGNLFQVERTIEKIGSIEKIEKYIQNELSNYDEFENIDFLVNNTPGLQLTPQKCLLKCKELSVMFSNYSTAIKCLKQFDPQFLKDLSFFGFREVLPNELCNLIQMNLKYLRLDDILINDNQLVQLNAEELYIYGDKVITSEGINKYIKKRLLSLDQSCCKFTFQFESDVTSLDTICRDLDVEFSEKDENGTTFIINSPLPQLQFKLNANKTFVFGENELSRKTTRKTKTSRIEEVFRRPPSSYGFRKFLKFFKS